MPDNRHPLRFGVIDESSQTRERWLQQAQTVERLGYATFLIRDHFIAGEFAHQLAPIAALMAAADATTTLRVGSLVFSNDYRHPAVLAKEAATIDVLSSGRFELGLGAGWLREEYTQTGIPFAAPGERVERLSESIAILKQCFDAKPVTFAGKHYTLMDYDSFPKPMQQPHPPLLIGAGSRHMLELAAREADIIGILPRALPQGSISDEPEERLASTVERKIGWIRAAAGDRFDTIELSIVVNVIVTSDRVHYAEEHMHKHGWQHVDVAQVLEMPGLLIGTEDEIVGQIRTRRERFGFSYLIVSDAKVEEFAPIVRQLAGQ